MVAKTFLKWLINKWPKPKDTSYLFIVILIINWISTRLDSNYCSVCVFVLLFSPFFFFSVHICWLFHNEHRWRTHKFHLSVTFSLKMGLMALFSHLKIILLQYFLFSIFNFSKINSIQTDPKCSFANGLYISIFMSWVQSSNPSVSTSAFPSSHFQEKIKIKKP